MARELFSELRTIYETTGADPHTFRITIKLKDIVDGAVLRQAVDRTMRRYPYFCVRMCVQNDTVYFEDNPAPLPVLNTGRRTTLGSAQTDGHLMAFCYRKNRLYIDAYHGLTDGGGIAPLIKTLLYEYCGAYYGKTLSKEGIRLSGSVVAEAELEDPALRPVPEGQTLKATKWSGPALQIEEAGVAHPAADSIVYNVRIPETEFMCFNLSHDGSPATIIALFLARAIDTLHPDAAEPPVIAMCVNQRKALHAPLAHQSLVGDVRLPFTGRMRGMDLTGQATCFRGMVSLQSDEDMVLEDIRQYQQLMERLKAMPGFAQRQACCVQRMRELSRCVTATVSYVGKADLGDAERYIQEYEALPSTALPSTHVPLTIEMSAVHGFFFVNFIQYFSEDDYFSAFIGQLRRNGIDYDVLNMTKARYPHMQMPF